MALPVTITCAPCCWGVDDISNPHLPPWERVLDEAAGAGFGGLELGPYGYMPLDAARVGAALEARGLGIVAGTIFDDLVSPRNRENLLRQTNEICTLVTALPRPEPERKVLEFVGGQPLDLLYVSAVTLAEIRFGIEFVADAGRRAELNDWLAHKVRPMFEQRVLPISEDVMFKWRLLIEDGRKVGHTFSQPDLIIAATALHHGLAVVTRDVSDYQKARAPVLNPWLDAEPTSAA